MSRRCAPFRFLFVGFCSRFPFRFNFVLRIGRLTLAQQQSNRHFDEGQAILKIIEQITLIQCRKRFRHIAKQHDSRRCNVHPRRIVNLDLMEMMQRHNETLFFATSGHCRRRGNRLFHRFKKSADCLVIIRQSNIPICKASPPPVGNREKSSRMSPMRTIPI